MRKLFFILMLMAFPSWASSPNILVSIKPLQLLVNSLTEGQYQVDYLVSPNVSPHDYALRPSDVRALRQADLVIWVGEELEPFLSKPLNQSHSSQLKLLDIKGLELIKGEAEHEHHGDHHHELDPHIWLGPQQARSIAQALTEQLVAMQVKPTAELEQQLTRFNQKLERLVSDIQQQLEPVKHQGYFVFHDGYSYFEQYFGLNRLGEFTINPQRRPGAKTLQHIRQQLAEGKAQCIFAEPQFNGALLETISQDSGAKISLLDPLGITVKNTANGYFDLLQQLADSYEDCLLDDTHQ